VPRLEPHPKRRVPSAEPAIADCGRASRAEQRACSAAYGLGDTGTGMARTQLGSNLFVFIPGSRRSPGLDGRAGWLMVIQGSGTAYNESLRGLLSDHTKRPLGSAAALDAWSAVPGWGWRWPPTGGAARAALAEFALLSW